MNPETVAVVFMLDAMIFAAVLSFFAPGWFAHWKLRTRARVRRRMRAERVARLMTPVRERLKLRRRVPITLPAFQRAANDAQGHSKNPPGHDCDGFGAVLAEVLTCLTYGQAPGAYER